MENKSGILKSEFQAEAKAAVLRIFPFPQKHHQQTARAESKVHFLDVWDGWRSSGKTLHKEQNNQPVMMKRALRNVNQSSAAASVHFPHDLHNYSEITEIRKARNLISTVRFGRGV